jgi:hypothetical protein
MFQRVLIAAVVGAAVAEGMRSKPMKRRTRGRGLGSSSQEHIRFAESAYKDAQNHYMNAFSYDRRGECRNALEQSTMAMEASTRMLCHIRSSKTEAKVATDFRTAITRLHGSLLQRCVRGNR